MGTYRKRWERIERADEYRKRWERVERVDNVCLFVLAMLALAALTAPDITMFVINVQNNCSVGTEGGESLSKWMYGMSITHFLMVSTVFVMGGLVLSDVLANRIGYKNAKSCSIVMSGCCFIVYCVLFFYTVEGFKLREEIRFHGVNNKQCNQAVLAWCILSILSYIGCFGTLCFVVYKACC